MPLEEFHEFIGMIDVVIGWKVRRLKRLQNLRENVGGRFRFRIILGLVVLEHRLRSWRRSHRRSPEELCRQPLLRADRWLFPTPLDLSIEI